MTYGQICAALSEIAVFGEGECRLVDHKALRYEGPAYKMADTQLTPLVDIASRLRPDGSLAWADDEAAAKILDIPTDLHAQISAAQDAETNDDPDLRRELRAAVGLRQ